MRLQRWNLAWALLGSLTACDPAVVDHSPTSNLLDAETASLEAGVGHWTAWYGTKISRAPGAARQGEASLRIELTEPYGWGVALDNYPGFPATPGAHRATFWARAVRGSSLRVEMRVSWRDARGEELQAHRLAGPVLGADWVNARLEMVAPANAERVSVDLTGSEGDPGDALEVDGISIHSQPDR
ncbi:hypothetical protein ACN28E_09655 [Archangium lansingense]|uniref:hypothetical protein n=1 Tax=Archangium lansingense TaxID=2995310 RepID=UPI003B7A45BD